MSARKAKQFIGPLAVAIWAIVVVAGMAEMVHYQMTPQADGKGMATWPARANLVRDAACPTLVMFLHPQCPCSRASLNELAQIIAKTDQKMVVDILFVQPSGASVDWVHSDLWLQAHAIPAVHVGVDANGHDAAAFGATVSGQVDLYDTKGKLLFAGGVTDGRGHEGDNAGVDSILALVRNQTAHVNTTPVYGCTLMGCSKPAGGR
jgi:hypothetical protein